MTNPFKGRNTWEGVSVADNVAVIPYRLWLSHGYRIIQFIEVNLGMEVKFRYHGLDNPVHLIINAPPGVETTGPQAATMFRLIYADEINGCV